MSKKKNRKRAAKSNTGGNGGGAGPIHPDGATANYSVAAINERIARDFSERLKLERDIKDAIDEHVKPLREARTKLKRELKAAVDIDGEDLDVMFAVFKRKEQGAAMDEAGDRERVAENLRIVFNALVKGQMLNFIDVIGTDYVPTRATAQQAERDQEAAAAG